MTNRLFRDKFGVLACQIVNTASTTVIGTRGEGTYMQSGSIPAEKQLNALLVHSQPVPLQRLMGISAGEANVLSRHRRKNFGYCPGRTCGRLHSHCSEPVPLSSCWATYRWVTNAKSGRGVPMANKYCRGTAHGKTGAARGFTTVELLIVVVISLVAAGMAVPGYTSITRYLRIAGDARNLNGLIAEAKMRAAQDFTHARARANLATNTFQLEVWDQTGNGGAGCWKTEGDTVNPCTAPNSPVQALSLRVAFGFGGVVASLPNPQTVIGQAPACLVGVAGGPALGTIANTSCIEFNS